MPTSTEAVAVFARELNEDVRTNAADGAPYTTEAECFAHTALEMLSDSGVVEDPTVCVRQGRIGNATWKLGGWAFPPSDDEDLTNLSLLALYFLDSPDVLPVEAAALRNEFQAAVRFVELMMAGHASDLEPAADAAELGRIIHDRRSVLRRITVHLVTDGLTQRLKSIESAKVAGVEVDCEIWDIERLSRLSDLTNQEIDIDIPAINDGNGLPCLAVPENDPHYDAYLCVVPGMLLARAYEKHGQRLLEQNVRAFLPVTGKVNKEIRKTIRENPERFFPYNNGLALTARSVEVQPFSDGRSEIVRIVGLQIVNGGQTTASIHRAWKVDRASAEVGRVFVQAKLTVIMTETNDDEQFTQLVRSISKFANSQNAVKQDDLESNQPWHIQFEQQANAVWAPGGKSQWFYERARGSYATAKAREAVTVARKNAFNARYPRSQVITKTDLAKAWNAWMQRPEIVSLGGQKNFRFFMDALDSRVQRPELDDTEFKRVVGRVILFREATRIVNAQKERILAFRANVVAYLVAYLAFRLPGELDFEKIWTLQKLPSALEQMLARWTEPIFREIVSSAGERNVTEWCKKADCWKRVRHLELDVPAAVDALVDASSVANQDDENRESAAEDASEVMRLTMTDWRELQEWCARTPDVYFKAPGIIASLYRMAISGWKRRPSARQARAMRGLIDRWRTDSGEGV